MAISRRFCMFSSWLFKAACRWGNLAALACMNCAILLGVVGTLTQPAGKVRVTPCPETVSAPNGACAEEEIGVLSCRLAHGLCTAWKAPHPKASPDTAAATRSSECFLSRETGRGAAGEMPGSGAATPAEGAGGDSGLIS